MPRIKPNLNPELVQFLARRLFKEKFFKKPIFLQVFLIIRLFDFIPTDSIITTRRHYKAVKITILKYVLSQDLYEEGCSVHYQMHKWGKNSQPLHRHYFLNAMHNLGYFKPRMFKLLYSTARHGFSNSKFHELCDKKGPTMTIFTLNGKMVVAILKKSWNVLDLGWKYDPYSELFFVDHDGTTVEFAVTCESERQKYYNCHSSGPHFGGLPVDLSSPRTGVNFWQRKLITGGSKIYHANIDSVVVLQMGGSALPP